MHSYTDPITDLVLHYNSDWSGDVILSYREDTWKIAARRLIAGIGTMFDGEETRSNRGVLLPAGVAIRATALAGALFMKNQLLGEFEDVLVRAFLRIRDGRL